MSGCKEGILIDFSDVDSATAASTEPDPIEKSRRWVMGDVNMEASFLRTAVVMEEKGMGRESDSLLGSSPIKLITDEEFHFDILPETRPKTTKGEEVFKKSASKEQKSSKNSNSSVDENWAEIQREANKLADIISQAGPQDRILSEKQLNLGKGSIADNIIFQLEAKAKPAEKLFCEKKLLLGEDLFAKDVLGDLESVSHAHEKIFPKKTPLLGEDLFAKNGLKSLQLESNNEAEEEKVNFDFDKFDTSIHVSPVKKQKLETRTLDKLASGEFHLGRRKSPRLNKPVRESLEKMEVPESRMIRTAEDVPVTEKSERKGVARAHSMSKIKPPTRLAKPAASSIPAPNANSSLNVTASSDTRSVSPASSVEDLSFSKVPAKSRLSAPKAATLLPSKLKIPAAAANHETKPSQSASQKVLPTKLQLLRPSRLQRPAGPTPSNDSEMKPMKAFAPQSIMEDETPVKADKQVKPKSLSSDISTPAKSGSTSSMDSPVGSVHQRRSFLPTPTKSRLSSVGSLPSPCGSRTSSTSSCRSLESPRPTKGSSSKMGDSANLENTSPNAMTSKRPLVLNTPNVPKKRISPWSPIQKKPIDHVDLAFMCTKKVCK